MTSVNPACSEGQGGESALAERHACGRHANVCRLAGAPRAAETARAVQLHRGPLRWLLLAAAWAWPGNGRASAPTDGGPRSVVTRSARGRLLSRGMRERGRARPARDLLRLPKTPSFPQDAFVSPRRLRLPKAPPFFRREMQRRCVCNFHHFRDPEALSVLILDAQRSFSKSENARSPGRACILCKMYAVRGERT